MLTLALCLSKEHEVSIMWDKTPSDEIVKKAYDRFGFDLSTLTFTPSIFFQPTGLLERYNASRMYDAVVYLSDGSVPLVGCPLILHFQTPMNWVQGKSFKNKLKLTRVKKIICNSQFTKSYIDKTFGIQSDVLYPPVTVQTSYDQHVKENIILNVGRFGINHAGSSYKKQDVLADTFQMMTQEGLRGWKLVFVMSVMEQDKETLEEFQKRYAGSPIEFVVNPTNDILWEYYKKAKIYWHASGYGEDVVNHPDRAEHFGISTVEAMGSGAVPVVINAGGQREIINDSVDGRLWGSVDELKEITLSLINDETTLQSMALAGVKSAERFNLDRFCNEVAALVK